MEQGNFSRQGVGSGMFECKVDFGPGCRIHLGRNGEELISPLEGGSKKRHAADMEAAIGKKWTNDARERISDDIA